MIIKDTTMLFRNELESYPVNVAQLNKLMLQLEEIESKLYDVSAIQYDKELGATNDQAQMELLKLDLIERKDKLEMLIGIFRVKVLYIDSILDKIPEDDKILLQKHFFEGQSYAKLAEEYHYSERNMRYKVDKVLNFAYQQRIKVL